MKHSGTGVQNVSMIPDGGPRNQVSGSRFVEGAAIERDTGSDRISGAETR